VIGIGGLGHMGIMWASKLNDASAEVTAISHNSNKKEAALKLGATKFLDTSDEKAVKEHARYFDYILCTANGKGQDYANWMSIIKLDGTFCTVGIPEAPISFGAFSVIGARASFTGSLIGSRKEIEDMLKFVDEHPELPPLSRSCPWRRSTRASRSSATERCASAWCSRTPPLEWRRLLRLKAESESFQHAV